LVELLPGYFLVEAIAPAELENAVELGYGCQDSVEFFSCWRDFASVKEVGY
jgi:hypothetical protein